MNTVILFFLSHTLRKPLHPVRLNLIFNRKGRKVPFYAAYSTGLKVCAMKKSVQ